MKFRKDFVTNSSSTSFGASFWDIIIAILLGIPLNGGADLDEPEGEEVEGEAYSIEMAVSKDVLRTDGEDFIWVYGKVNSKDEKEDTEPFTKALQFSLSGEYGKIVRTDFIDGYKTVCVKAKPLSDAIADTTAPGSCSCSGKGGSASIDFMYELYAEPVVMEVTTEPQGKNSLQADGQDTIFAYARISEINEEGQVTDLVSTRNIDFNVSGGGWMNGEVQPDLIGDWKCIALTALKPAAADEAIVPPQGIVTINGESSTGKKFSEKIAVTIEAEPSIEVNAVDLFFLSGAKQSENVLVKIKNVDLSKWDYSFEYIGKENICTIEETDRSDNGCEISYRITESEEGSFEQNPGRRSNSGKYTFKLSNAAKSFSDYVKISVMREGLYFDSLNEDEKDYIELRGNGTDSKRAAFFIYRWNEESKQLEPYKEGLENIYLQYKLANSVLVQNAAEVTGLDMRNPEPYGSSGISYEFFTVNMFPMLPDYAIVKLGAETTVEEDHFTVDFDLHLLRPLTRYGEEEWQKEYEETVDVIFKIIPSEFKSKFLDLLNEKKMELEAEGLRTLRKTIIDKASEMNTTLAEGYLKTAYWLDWAVYVLEWVEFAADIVVSACINVMAGPLSGIAIDVLRSYIVEGIKAKAEGIPPAQKEQSWLDKFYEPVKAMGLGFATDPQTIEYMIGTSPKVCALAWTIYFAYNFYVPYSSGKGLYESAKIAITNFSKRIAVQYLSGKFAKKWEVDQLNMAKEKIQPDGSFDPDDMLEMMKNSKFVRSIKESGDDALQAAFNNTLKKTVYQPHDTALTHWIKTNVPELSGKEIRVGDFSTPGKTGSKVNTDRDYRVQVKVGDDWVEVPTSVWKDKSMEIFGNLTGYDPKTAAGALNVSQDAWDAMSEAERRELWAERQYRQLPTDASNRQACKDFSDQNADGISNIVKVKNGQGKLLDPDDMARMYKQKAVDDLTIGNNPSEAIQQIKKGRDELISIRNSYISQGYKVPAVEKGFIESMKELDTISTNLSGNNRADYYSPSTILDYADRLAEEIKKLKDC